MLSTCVFVKAKNESVQLAPSSKEDLLASFLLHASHSSPLPHTYSLSNCG